MKHYSVLMTDVATTDLLEIATYLAKLSGEKSIALAFVQELREKCTDLESFPERGALPKDRMLRSNGYRYLVYKEYLIFYTVDEVKAVVSIMAIFNGKRDYFRVLKGKI